MIFAKLDESAEDDTNSVQKITKGMLSSGLRIGMSWD